MTIDADERDQERRIRAWLVRHFDDPDPPRAATWYIAELLDLVVQLRLALESRANDRQDASHQAVTDRLT